MAWGYSPQPVVKARHARLDTDKAKGLGFLLFLVSGCASLLAFGIITSITDTPKPSLGAEIPGQPGGAEVREKPESDFNSTEIEWKTQRRNGKRYGDYSKKPKRSEADMSMWERFEAEEKAREEEERNRRDPSANEVRED